MTAPRVSAGAARLCSALTSLSRGGEAPCQTQPEPVCAACARGGADAARAQELALELVRLELAEPERHAEWGPYWASLPPEGALHGKEAWDLATIDELQDDTLARARRLWSRQSITLICLQVHTCGSGSAHARGYTSSPRLARAVPATQVPSVDSLLQSKQT